MGAVGAVSAAHGGRLYVFAARLSKVASGFKPALQPELIFCDTYSSAGRQFSSSNYDIVRRNLTNSYLVRAQNWAQQNLSGELSRRTHRFITRTLPMPAIAGDGESLACPLAVGAAILAALRCRAFTSRMSTRGRFLFGHENLLAPLVR
jgi:hypothetical protein